MVCSLMELRCKEVVNIQNGACLGCVCDVEFDTCTAHICTLIIFGRPRFFGLFGREPDLIIPWDQIKCIGEDTVLVENGMPGTAPSSDVLCRGFALIEDDPQKTADFLFIYA